MNNRIDVIFNTLKQAEVEQIPVERFTKNQYPDFTVEEGYAVQEKIVQYHIDQGKSLLAPKMGLTSYDKMAQMGVDTPIYGYVFQEMIQKDVVDLTDCIHPKIEPEIVIVLKNDLTGPGITKEDVLANIDYITSGLEILDSRYINFDFKLSDVIADNTSAKKVVLSDTKIRLEEIDLVEEQVDVYINQQLVASGKGKNVLDHPVESVAMLANMLADKGESVRAGQPIMTGGMTQAVKIQANQQIDVKFSKLAPIHIQTK